VWASGSDLLRSLHLLGYRDQLLPRYPRTQTGELLGLFILNMVTKAVL
jgi:hypothetical protein